MAVQFYARYVPSEGAGARQGSAQKDHLAIRPAKRKKSHASQNHTINTESSPVSSSVSDKALDAREIGTDVVKAVANIREHEATSENAMPSADANDGSEKPGHAMKQKRKKKRPKVEASDNNILPDRHDVANDKEVDQQDKHRRVRSKFESSIKRAAYAVEENHATTQHEGEQLEKLEASGLIPLPQPAEKPDLGTQSVVSALPEWLSRPVYVNSETTVPFDQLSLSKSVVNHLFNADIQNAFAIQSAVLRMLLSGPEQHGGDLCVSAATGSGKTLAYTLPIVEALRNKPVVRLRALIVVPTRELVTQVQSVFHVCGSRLKVGTAVGNKSLREERAALIEVFQKFDPDAYEKLRQEALNQSKGWAAWTDVDIEADRPEPDCVIEYDSLVDVLICTPGRLVEHIRSTKGFTLEHLQWLVIDEADRLLDQSFQQWIDVVIPALAKKKHNNGQLGSLLDNLLLRNPERVRKIILSATMTKDLSKLVALDLYNPALVSLEGEDDRGGKAHEPALEEPAVFLPAQLHELAVPIRDATDKPLYLVQLIQELLPPIQLSPAVNDDMSSISSVSYDSSSEDSPSSAAEANSISSSSDPESPQFIEGTTEVQVPARSSNSPSHGILIFTNTNENALRLCRLLIILRPSWDSSISSLTKSTGTSSARKTIAAFRKGQLSIIIASDRASRGLDLKDLAHVINYDMPRSVTGYVHRIGRTARAGKSGTATTLVAHHEARWFWNEIGRSQQIKRAQKVVRREAQLAEILENDRNAYEAALKQLGDEAKGKS